jgi:nucleoid-associated protein YejK
MGWRWAGVCLDVRAADIKFPLRSLLTTSYVHGMFLLSNRVSLTVPPTSGFIRWGGTAMIFENLQVGRISIHEVYQRDADRRRKEPSCADALETLGPAAVTQFKQRVTAALSAEGKSLQMKIVKFDTSSHLHDVREMVNANDAKFLDQSKHVPNRLADVQMHQNIPGGVVLVFDGTVGAQNYKYVGVIKAEKQSGFRRRRDRNTTLTEFLDDLFLTPAQRLYKVGVFVEVSSGQNAPNGWDAFVFDTNISKSHREAAALYFYDAFLGCGLMEDGAYETARFFDLTKEFVRKSDLSRDKKQDLVDALHTFVKAETSSTFTANEYAQQYLPTATQDAFNEFLGAHRFPLRAVVRDVTQMGNRLRRRRFRFGSDIELSVTAEALNSKTVEIKTGKASDFGGRGADPWTRITIRHSMTDER